MDTATYPQVLVNYGPSSITGNPREFWHTVVCLILPVMCVIFIIRKRPKPLVSGPVSGYEFRIHLNSRYIHIKKKEMTVTPFTLGLIIGMPYKILTGFRAWFFLLENNQNGPFYFMFVKRILSPKLLIDQIIRPHHIIWVKYAFLFCLKLRLLWF